MGDEGKLYNGVTPSAINSMREMLEVANLCYPNYTEACYLTDTPYREEGVTMQEARQLLDKLRNIGTESMLITSIKVDGNNSVMGYNKADDEYFQLLYTEIPVHFPGTGDIFSAVLIGHLLNDEPLKKSTRMSMDAVSKLIELNKDNKDKNRGIPLEKYLSII
jgi:pyridoxine kinase